LGKIEVINYFVSSHTMFSRTVAFLPQLLSRIPKLAAFGVRLYISLAVIQFVCGFMAVVGLAMFGYDLDFIYSFLPVDTRDDSSL
jgi:hypothetical protein